MTSKLSKEVDLNDKILYLNQVNEIKTLENELKDSKAEIEFIRRYKSLKLDIETRHILSLYNEKIDELKSKIDNTEIEYEHSNLEFNSKLNLLVSEHLVKLEQLHRYYKSKIENEEKNNVALNEANDKLEQELKLNIEKLNDLQLKNERDQYESIENEINNVKEKFTNKISILENKIQGLNLYEDDFEKEIEEEMGEMGYDFFKQISVLKSENEMLSTEIKVLKNEIKQKHDQINNMNARSAKGDEEMASLLSKIKELNETEINSFKELKNKEDLFIQTKNLINILENECDLIEASNMEKQTQIDKLEKELSLANLENKKLLNDQIEIQTDIKAKKLELHKLKSIAFSTKLKLK
jgi:chromosome segregation ATPase